MPNSKAREWERRRLRRWSAEDQDWVAPPPEEGGPEVHNANTYSNWHCRCTPCKAAHNEKHRKTRPKEGLQSIPTPRSPSSTSAPANDPPSKGASSVGSGATSTGSPPKGRRQRTSGSGRGSTSR